MNLLFDVSMEIAPKQRTITDVWDKTTGTYYTGMIDRERRFGPSNWYKDAVAYLWTKFSHAESITLDP